MVATDKLFAGMIPEIYEQFLVPLIFESYAGDLAERVAKVKPRDVLETAAGTIWCPARGQPGTGFLAVDFGNMLGLVQDSPAAKADFFAVLAAA
jgi:hypothetical protein